VVVREGSKLYTWLALFNTHKENPFWQVWGFGPTIPWAFFVLDKKSLALNWFYLYNKHIDSKQAVYIF
jgi:hypothetical protein